jgi:hypothetical protein
MKICLLIYVTKKEEAVAVDGVEGVAGVDGTGAISSVDNHPDTVSTNISPPFTADISTLSNQPSSPSSVSPSSSSSFLDDLLSSYSILPVSLTIKRNPLVNGKYEEIGIAQQGYSKKGKLKRSRPLLNEVYQSFMTAREKEFQKLQKQQLQQQQVVPGIDRDHSEEEATLKKKVSAEVVEEPKVSEDALMKGRFKKRKRKDHNEIQYKSTSSTTSLTNR